MCVLIICLVAIFVNNLFCMSSLLRVDYCLLFFQRVKDKDGEIIGIYLMDKLINDYYEDDFRQGDPN